MLVVCIFPLMMIQIRSKYEILFPFIEKIGRTHTDECGEEIAYTNIETDEFYYVKEKEQGKVYDKRTLGKIQDEYSRRYVKQIIQFHQKLLFIDEKVTDSRFF